jgi:hypothetical protein
MVGTTAATRTFEIHIFQGGRWKIDSVFDDRELALFEAQRMDGSGRYSGVRVVEESVHGRTRKALSRTIFRGNNVTRANENDLEARQEAEIERRRKAARDAERRRIQQRESRKNEANPYRLISIFLLLVSIGFGALYALEKLRQAL